MTYALPLQAIYLPINSSTARDDKYLLLLGNLSQLNRQQSRSRGSCHSSIRPTGHMRRGCTSLGRVTKCRSARPHVVANTTSSVTL
jgi:hypothetical protein